MMKPENHIVINDRFAYSGESKKYRSTQEQIERNQRDKVIQRERDERAPSEAFLDGNHNRRSAEHQDTQHG